MARRWLIVADDLTGAADCAVAFAKRGLDAVVLLGDGPNEDASVLAVDADSRQSPASQAAARQVAAVRAYWRPGTRLYKKIDSTLRGQPAAELAAQLSALAFQTDKRAPLAVVAPAFPAAGRVTLAGRVLVDGAPLETTSLWSRDHTYADARLPEVLASAGLSADVIALDVIRAGPQSVLGHMQDAERRGVAAVVCDCVTEDDLAIVAAASLKLDAAVWVGSAGLAGALAGAMPPAPLVQLHVTAHSHPVLILVGSLAEASRRQARVLVESRLVTHIVVMPEVLLAGPRTSAWQPIAMSLSDGLQAGEDVLLEIGLVASPDLARGAELAANLAELVAQVAPKIGAIVATGGEIARAVLARLGVRGIRLMEEVEPGVPLGMTLGALTVPIVTKAGAFGDTDTLRRCLARLKDSEPARVSK